MSNTSIVTKLLSLVKGAFGRKDTASDAVRESQAENKGPAAENGGGEHRTSTATMEQAAPAEQAEEAATSAPEETAEVAEVPKAEKPAPAGTAGEKAPAEKAAPAEEPAPEAGTPAPATDDVPEKAAAIAEELGANDNHTEVASDEVLERVRKGAAPSAEELAVPTYDELTLPSIRARLRKLTVDQVRDLRSYEVAHQSRPEFVKMYDNRIAKLQAEEN
ncbi:hypothetical protein GCM10007147_32300 [Nocardiopsis kunsanensis]|uniref:Uncharacterized protein n=1 Tax=Nocardiopsis kunsanensis TaxID=141693 RepID=A0A918XH43_9ACTN|nr:hypothetical protein [Nocardiopsis kunsanensis]GHD30471.1 hypothetical protein GCM10007147_32300 [Nocardiopsis kunsanensis]